MHMEDISPLDCEQSWRTVSGQTKADESLFHVSVPNMARLSAQSPH